MIRCRFRRGSEAQTRQVMDNLKRVLAGVGAGLEHVVSVRIFLTDFERDYALFNGPAPYHLAAGGERIQTFGSARE